MHNESWRQYIRKFNENDEEFIRSPIPNAEAEGWTESEVPFFECPDRIMEETYYFRWWVFRKHIRDTGNGRIITEFLPAVDWAGPYNSINCASCHHIAEARWLKNDRELAGEYIRFWLCGEGDETAYSSWIADAVYQYALASDDRRLAVGILPELVSYYERLEERNMTRYGLFWSVDDRDGMELSISGNGLRPTLNSYMYGNAAAIASVADWAGDRGIAERFGKKAAVLKERMLELLWDPQDHFFKVIPQEKKEDAIPNFSFQSVPRKRCALEEIGYIPWGFFVPGPEYDRAWRYLSDDACFHAPYGIMTAQRNHPLFMKSGSEHECQWNGPVWPYATTQTLNGLIRLLQSRGSAEVDRQVFFEQLSQYARSHYRMTACGKRINWLDENLHPDTGIWLAREILEGWGWQEGKGGYERGKDYNHSTFCDLVIRGICGIKPVEDRYIVIDPLIPEGKWAYFMLEDLPYKNHRLTVGYDKDGSRYQKGMGLWLELDGQVVAKAPGLSRMKIAI